jgi:hypothetical protein
MLTKQSVRKFRSDLYVLSRASTRFVPNDAQRPVSAVFVSGCRTVRI